VRSDARAGRRPRLLILNQYYWPGVEATANLLTQLAEALAEEYDVTVVTGAVKEKVPSREVRNGVTIVRMRSTVYDRSRLSRRGLNYVTYVLGIFRHAFALPRPDVVLCMTDPPFVGAISLVVGRRFRAPLVVISQDVFPEIAVQLGRLTNPALVNVLRLLVSIYLRRADRIVAIGETMRERLVAKGAPRERVAVIPNWVDTSLLQPAAKDNEWSRERGLAEAFVVMHSGNVGHAQDLDSLVRAMTYLRDVERLRAVIIGRGARHSELVELAERLEVDDAVTFMNYQPREQLAYSLSAADIHVVGLASGLAGFAVPSRLYGILAVARPVIVAADDDSETARVVREVGCGVVVPPNRPDAIAGAIREALRGDHDLEAMGRAGREWVVAEGDVNVAIGRYRALLDEVRSARG
jgi:colanic acid biosynthesis glycosyl transferase WcaI